MAKVYRLPEGPSVDPALVPILKDLANLKAASSILFHLSVDMPEPYAAQVGWLAQQMQGLAEHGLQGLRGLQP